MAKTTVKELEDDFWSKYSLLTPKQQIFFQEYVMKGVSQVEAYKIAYDCAGMKFATIQRNASREANKNKFRTCKIAFDKWQAADSMGERRDVEKSLYCSSTLELGDISYIDPATGTPKMRTMANMTEKGKRGAKFKISSKYGLVIESNNSVAAAAQLSKMKGWDAPVQVHHSGDAIGGRRVIRIGGKRKDDNG